MQLVLPINRSFLKFIITVLLLLGNNNATFSQLIKQNQRIRFIWTDNTFKTSSNTSIYILSAKETKNDTIFPSLWNPSKNDTVYFDPGDLKNPVYLEIKVATIKKLSNKFNIIPNSTYNLTEFDDKLEVKIRPIIFDTLDSKARLLYSFLIKLVLELLLAIPVAALLRLPARLLFFVFVANIMTFPIIYLSFFSPNIKEIITILLEGLFIYLIGWKRLKITKALLVSVLINVIRFGIYKIVMLFIKII